MTPCGGHIIRVLSRAAELFATEPREGAREAVAALRSATLPEYRSRHGTGNPRSLLAEVAALPDALPITQDILAAEAELQWESWAPDVLDQKTSAGLFSTELLGPDGHFPAPNVRVGLLLSAPHIDYPMSSHSGEETYIVLAGHAEWVLRDAAYTDQPPGAIIHHPAWAPHGRRTGPEPFLGLWRWSGELGLDSFKLADDG